MGNATGDEHIPAGGGPNIRYKSKLMAQKVEIIGKHPFHLALESTDKEPGFVTEKIFQVLPFCCLTHFICCKPQYRVYWPEQSPFTTVL